MYTMKETIKTIDARIIELIMETKRVSKRIKRTQTELAGLTTWKENNLKILEELRSQRSFLSGISTESHKEE